MEEKKEKCNNIIGKLKEKKKIIGIAMFVVIIIFIIFGVIINQLTNNFDFDKYSIKAQEIIYAIEYYDTLSLDSKELKELDNEILEESKKNKTKEIKNILFNYHMGIGMMADNINTDNDMILSNIKSYLEEAEKEYKSLLLEKNKSYKEITKKEEYQKIDNYKLSDLLDLKVDYSPDMNVNAIYSIGTSLYTGYSRFIVTATNKVEKDIKYIEISVDICNNFQDKLMNIKYKCIGPFSYMKASTIKFDEEYISDYKIAKYIKLESVKITYTDNSIINIKSEKIDREAQEIKIYY